MAKLGTLVHEIRSKNAGPFWLTIDIFCHGFDNFSEVSEKLSTSKVASLFGANKTHIKRFNITELHVIKFSLPRPHIQGVRLDRDMHGASFACLLEEFEL